MTESLLAITEQKQHAVRAESQPLEGKLSPATAFKLVPSRLDSRQDSPHPLYNMASLYDLGETQLLLA